MKKFVSIGLGALSVLVLALGLVPPAQAYPELSCNVTVNAQRVASGDVLKVHATSQQFTTEAKAAADAVSWRAVFDGVVRTARSSTFDTSFDVPTFAEPTTRRLVVRAVMPDSTTSCERSLDIAAGVAADDVVAGPGGDNGVAGENLPNTGGPRLIFLILGVGLVVAGGAAVRQSRKGSAHQS